MEMRGRGREGGRGGRGGKGRGEGGRIGPGGRESGKENVHLLMFFVFCRELKKHSFLEFYDYYISTARQLSATIEGQQMIVSTI